MIVKMPTGYNYNEKARYEDGILKVFETTSWKKLALEMVVAIQGKKCCYCGRYLNDRDITVDHLFPQSCGGLTFPDNIAPCCKACNNAKGNLTEKQFRHILAAPACEKGIIRRKFLLRNESVKGKRGFVLPREWIRHLPTETLIATSDWLKERTSSREDKKVERFFKEFHKFPYPVLVDRKGCVLDGISVLLFAKKNEIKKIPAIVMDNVEIVQR